MMLPPNYEIFPAPIPSLKSGWLRERENEVVDEPEFLGTCVHKSITLLC